MRMMRTILNARSLGGACVIVGAGDTLFRMAGIFVVGAPLGLFAIFGLGLLLRRNPFSKVPVRGVIFTAGITFAWTAMVAVVLLFAQPTNTFSLPTTTLFASLAGYLAVSIVFGLWGWTVLKRSESTETPIDYGDTAVSIGKALAVGVRRWLQ